MESTVDSFEHNIYVYMHASITFSYRELDIQQRNKVDNATP